MSEHDITLNAQDWARWEGASAKWGKNDRENFRARMRGRAQEAANFYGVHVNVRAPDGTVLHAARPEKKSSIVRGITPRVKAQR
jgi:hypothetical protein